MLITLYTKLNINFNLSYQIDIPFRNAIMYITIYTLSEKSFNGKLYQKYLLP